MSLRLWVRDLTCFTIAQTIPPTNRFSFIKKTISLLEWPLQINQPTLWFGLWQALWNGLAFWTAISTTCPTKILTCAHTVSLSLKVKYTPYSPVCLNTKKSCYMTWHNVTYREHNVCFTLMHSGNSVPNS